MPGADVKDDRDAVANHTLAYLRSHEQKLDLILDSCTRHNERRIERAIGEVRREVGDIRWGGLEIKSDMAFMEKQDSPGTDGNADDSLSDGPIGPATCR